MTNRAVCALALALAFAPLQAALAQGTASPVASRPAVPANQLDVRISELHTRLKITPSQEPLWAAFTKVMRDNSAQMADLYATGNPQTMSASDALGHYAKIAQAHADEIKNLVAPFQALYQSMDPAQKTAADQAFHSFQRGASHRPG